MAENSARPAGMFIRQSSGLVRELGVGSAFGINLGSIQPTGIGFFFFVILAGYPGSDLTVPVIIVFFIAVLLSLVYAQLLAAIPRSGSDFIYSSRILHPAVGAAVGVGFFIAAMIAVPGVNITVLANTYLPFIFQTFGNLLGASALTTFATTLTGKGATLIVSLIIVVITTGLLAVRVSTLARITFWAVVLGIVSVLLLIAEFALHSPQAFQTAFNDHAASANAYSQIISRAHGAGLHTGVQWGEVFGSMALVGGLYGGGAFATYTGGELRRPAWTFRLSTLAALAVMLVLTLVAWLVFRHTVGLDFAQSAAYLSTNDPTAYARIAGNVTAYVPSYALVIGTDPVSKVIIAIGFAAGVLSLILAGALILTRLLFALSFDQVIPAFVADVRPKSHIPLNAALIVGFFMLVTTILVVFTSIISATRNMFLILIAIYMLSSLCAAILPWRRKDLYSVAPKVLGPERLFGVPTVTLVGVASLILQGVLFYYEATQTQVSGGYDAVSIACLVVGSLLGLAFYFVSRMLLRRRGLNLDLAMRELPPE